MLLTKCSFDNSFQLFSTISVKASAWNLYSFDCPLTGSIFFVFIDKLNEKNHSDLISRIICNMYFLLAKYWLMSAGNTNRNMILAKLCPVMSLAEVSFFRK